MEVRPNSFEDIRNVMLYQGKLAIRSGFLETTTFTDPNDRLATHVIGGLDYPQADIGVVVTYEETFGEVYVWQVSASGTNPVLIGRLDDPTTVVATTDPWFTNLGNKSIPPKVFLAETGGVVFLAHDEPAEGLRAATMRFNLVTADLPPVGVYMTPLRTNTGNDATATPPTWNFDGRFDSGTPTTLETTSEIMYFRGVVQHLDYLIGWGFGGGDPNRQFRPEFIRISRPAQPDRFDAEGYFIVGSRQEPVTNCRSYNGELQIFKAQEAYKMVGQHRGNFGVFGMDHIYGLAGSQLAVAIPEGVLFWSEAGPRVSTGGPSQDLEIPLELEGYQPTGLPVTPDFQNAFAYFLETQRVVLFVFGSTAYALTVRNVGQWKWSYWELGFQAYSGFTLFTGFGFSNPPEPGPYWDAAGDLAGTTANVTYDNVLPPTAGAIQGDELVELWTRAFPVGTWVLNLTAAVDFAASQEYTLTNLNPGTDYGVRARYRRASQVNEFYEDAPGTWPSYSEGTFTTTIDPPTINSGVWARTDVSTETITLDISPVPGLTGFDIKIYENDILVDTLPNPITEPVEWVSTSFTNGISNKYQVVTVGGVDSPKSDPTYVWAGIEEIPDHIYSQGQPAPSWSAAWTNPGTPPAALEVEFFDDWDGAAPTGDPTFPRGDELAENDGGASDGLGGAPGGETIQTKIRYRLETGPASGVYDYSQYGTIRTATFD